MRKRYPVISDEQRVVEDPAMCVAQDSLHVPVKSGAEERVMASTVSVDEYFDELISQVRKDYEAL